MTSRNTSGMNPPYLTKQQGQQQAREKARLPQQAEAKRTRRMRLFVALGSSFVAILVIAAVAFVIWNGTKKEEMKPEASPSASVSTDGVISVGKGSSEGTARVGAKNADKLRVHIYSDYACTHCNDLEKERGNKLANLAGKGEIIFEIVPLSVLQ